MTDAPVMAITQWPTNADLIADVARLGYLHEDWLTLDPTYGLGTWWKKWRPHKLVAHDIDPAKSPTGKSVDFTDMPQYEDDTFDAVAFDPPYKLNGTPCADIDHRYGVHTTQTSRERHHLIQVGMIECARVLVAGGHFIMKCQNQVSSGRVNWQVDTFSIAGGLLGLEKIDELHMLSYRPQPEGTRQVHARRNYSTALVFRKPK